MKKKALLLDRDGVLNEEKTDSYIFTPDEFIWLPGVLEAMSLLKNQFDYLFVVTNQRGIARKLMTEEDLKKIHTKMEQDLLEVGVKLNGVYYAKGMDLKDNMRKPNPGMGQLIEQNFPDIHWEESVMIGNNLSDMEFGRNFPLKTILLTTTQPPIPLPHPLIDEQHPDLINWAKSHLNN